MAWTGEILDAGMRSAALNKKAAFWTAASVVLGAVSAILSGLNSN
jgi:hypothetical protein